MSSRIPFHRPEIGEEEIAAVTAVLRSGWLTTGDECRHFESEFAAFVGGRHAVALNSCTGALHLALEATGCRQGDCVLVPTFTFAATAHVVTQLGATPLLVDSERDTLNIDVKAAAHSLAELESGRPVGGVVALGRAHAIMPVHYSGQMVDVDGVAALAKRHGLRVIEDAAHAFPAAALAANGRWRSVGTTAEQTCFSFYANKTITTGEGGMLVTDDEALAARARLMSLHGRTYPAANRIGAGPPTAPLDYLVVDAGFKYNLTDIAAALGRQQLRKATQLAAARAKIAKLYSELLSDVAEVELPSARPDRQHAWHLYVVRLRLERLRISRKDFMGELDRNGISTSVHFRPLHLQPYYQQRFGYKPGHFPVASEEWERCISLPIFPSMDEATVVHVAQAIRSIARKYARVTRVSSIAPPDTPVSNEQPV